MTQSIQRPQKAHDLCIHEPIDLVLPYLSIFLLSVAALINTVEENSALVVLAVGLDKL